MMGRGPALRPMHEMYEPEPNSGCWLWLGPLDRDGYGRHGNIKAHRAVYEKESGPIPEGLTLDHKCRVRRCVNPAHLEPVTNRVNILRGDGRAALNARKTHCQRGHELAAGNLYITPAGRRRCRICHNWRKRRDRAALKLGTPQREDD